MTIYALKVFATCFVTFVVCAIIEDATKPLGTPLIIIKLIGGLAVMVGFVAMIVALLAFIWA